MDLKVFTSVALKNVIEGLASEFRQKTGCGLVMTYCPAPVVVRHLRDGASADVLIVTPDTWPVLVRVGRGVAGSERDIARSVVGVAVKAGAAHPKISTAEELRDTLLKARSVAYTDPSTGAASGVHFIKIAESLGIAEAMRAKAKLGSGGPVAEFVASGDAEIGIQQLCEHMLVPGVEVVGPLPEALNRVTTFTAGIAGGSAVPREGAAFIELLLAPHVQQDLPGHGLEPMAARS